MNSSVTRIVFIVCLVLIVACSRDSSRQDAAPVSSTELEKTVVAATLEQAIVPGKNVVFCAAFPLAWEELCASVVGGPVVLKNAVPLATALNQRTITTAILPASAYFAAAGTSNSGIVDTINTALAGRFGGAFPPVAYTFERPADVLVYACMQKNVPFATPFEPLEKPIAFNRDETMKVRSFGVAKVQNPEQRAAMLKRVTVFVDSVETGVGIVQIETANPDDEMIFAMFTPKSTLLETIEAVDELMTSARDAGGVRVCTGEFDIPEMDINITHRFQELVGAEFNAKVGPPLVIAAADESIRFRLDNTGARLESTAAVVAYASISNLHFRKPFLFMLRTKGQKLPYFAVWVENSEVLVPG